MSNCHKWECKIDLTGNNNARDVDTLQRKIQNNLQYVVQLTSQVQLGYRSEFDLGLKSFVSSYMAHRFNQE
jgi:hypothetical protein